MNQAALCVSCHGVLEADDANGLCAACLQRSLLFGDLDEVESLGGDLGDYEILSEIARGGMGVVFKARSRRLKRIVALKLVHVTTASRASMRQRFLFEAEIAAGLDHPNIVPVYEFGESDGRPWFSMKLVEGGSLEARLAEYVVPPDARDPARCRRVAELMSTVARAVQYAHDHGVLHRDLKPSNILVDESGVPHVTDFGLAKRLDGGGTMTLPEVVLGTPAYMAPEVARSGASAAGVRSDLYSLGAVLHHLLSGRPPFAAKSTLELIREVAESRQPTASKLGRHVDRDLAIICSKCLENPEQRRYATASELADDLDRYLRGEPIHARAITWVEQGWHWCRMRPVMTMLVGFLMLALGIGAAGILSQWQRAEDNLRKSEVSELLAVAAERKSGENAYFAQIAEAMSAREKGDLGRAARLLAMQGSGQGRFEWRLLSWLNQGDSTRQQVVPGGGVRCMTWVPQRQRVAMVGEDRVLRWLDPLTDVLEEGITIPALEDRHADVVLDRGFHAIGFAPDGRHLFCADGDLLMVLEAATIDFGVTAVGLPVAREFTVANAGYEGLVVSAVAAPAGFVLVDLPKVPFTIAPQNAITFSAILAAQSGGGASGDVVVTCNDADEGTFRIPVSGVVDGNSPSISQCANPRELVMTSAAGVALPDLTGEVVATDIEPGALTITQSPTAGTLLLAGTTVVTLTVRDTAGNESFCETAVTVVRKPTAGADFGETVSGVPTTFRGSRLLANDSDPDGEALTLTGVATTSANGGTISRVGDAVTYTPPGGFVGTDTFTYTLTAGSRTATGLVTVRVRTSDLIPSNAVYLRPVASPGTGMEMRFSGIAGRAYSVQFTETIGSGWTELSRQTAQAGSGFIDFVHTTPPPVNGFYRCLPAN